MKKINTDILILGAGWSGLLAASMLAQKGHNIIILEKESNIGGLAQTFEHNGFHFDFGGHRINFNKKENNDFLKTTFKQINFLKLKRKSKIFFLNEYLNYPLTLSSIIKFFKIFFFQHSFNIKLFLSSSSKTNKINSDISTKSTTQANFETWVKKNYSTFLYRIFFKDYTKKVWGISANELSDTWANNRVGKNNFWNFIKNSFIPNNKLKEKSNYFYYPPKGIGSLIKSLKNSLPENTKLFTQTKPIKFITKENQIESVVITLNNTLCEISFKHILSSIPIKNFLKLLVDPHKEQLDIIKKIKYRSLILVNIIIQKKHLTNWHWCYFQDKNIIFSRLVEPKYWSKNTCITNNHTLICAEIFCDYNDNLWNLSDKVLFEKVKEGLICTNLINTSTKISSYCIKKNKYAYPLLYYGFEETLKKAKTIINSFTNVSLIGRTGTHSYLDMEECLNDVINNLKKFE